MLSHMYRCTISFHKSEVRFDVHMIPSIYDNLVTYIIKTLYNTEYPVVEIHS